MTLKRYLAFAGDWYYPLGGWEDFVGSFGSIIDAKEAALDYGPFPDEPDWAHVVDVETGEKVWKKDEA